MAERDYFTPAPAGPAAVESCWLCGIRLPAGQMVADGGSACANVRWYCRDTEGCTQRWTANWASPGALDPGAVVRGLRPRRVLPAIT